MSRPCAIWIAVLVAGFCPSVWASTLSYSGFSVIDAQVVTLSGRALGGGSEQVYAGEITLGGVNGGGGTVQSFCIDVEDMLQWSGTFGTGSFVTGTLGRQIDALLVNGLPQIGGNPFASAALQVAIWEEEYGSALTVSGNDRVTGLAETFLENVAHGTWRSDPGWAVAELTGGGANQDQATLARVPEPGSMALMIGAVLGWAGLRRLRGSARAG